MKKRNLTAVAAILLCSSSVCVLAVASATAYNLYRGDALFSQEVGSSQPLGASELQAAQAELRRLLDQEQHSKRGMRLMLITARILKSITLIINTLQKRCIHP